jgi:acyl-CoA synthetase (AMP-forming)/AMP-acid ligase II/acyl carrier protein
MDHGDRLALTFVNDEGGEESWTYQQLWQRACTVAARLPMVDQDAPRALLLFPPGIEFLAGFLGCQIAGWTPVPTCYPKAGREIPRLDSVANDCVPSAIVADRATLDGLDSDKLCRAADQAARVVTDSSGATDGDWIDPDSLSIDPESLAFLQYTSGSTSEPKGVRVRHRNLLANLEAIRRGFQIDWQVDDGRRPDCGVFWLPFFHDMGLIGGILEPLYVGGHTVLMSPRSFLQRPIRWLQYISSYRAVISGAPNFAYQMAVDRISPEQAESLDLSCWRIAFCGAEPILYRTLQDFASRFAACGFSSAAFYPCYGLAEATLLAAGGDGPGEPNVLAVDRESLGQGTAKLVRDGRGRSVQKLVSNGSAAYQTELLVIDPATAMPLGEGQVGEIWLRGASIADGYWKRDQENRERFDATLSDGRRGYFRSGDLGFLHDGCLYVTGRLKDLIIIRGRNHFPQDIEATVRDKIGTQGGHCAAFAVDGGRGEALAIVAELPRRIDETRLPELVREIRRAVIDVHEVDPRHVLLVRQATVPLTSSGKVQHGRCRTMFDEGQFQPKYRYDRSAAGEQAPIPIPNLPTAPTLQDRCSMVRVIESWMTQWLIARAGVAPEEVELDKPFADYGLDSMTAVELSGEIEDWSGFELTPIVAWNHPTVSRLSSYIVDQMIGEGDDPQSFSQVSDAELADLLDEIEQLSADETDHELSQKRRP